MGRRGRDRVVVGLNTTYAISAYHHWCWESSNLDQGDVYNIMWYSLSVTCDRSVVFSGPTVSSTNITDRHDITEILLKVALNTIKQANKTWLQDRLTYTFKLYNEVRKARFISIKPKQH
jgi:hypothetical protein